MLMPSLCVPAAFVPKWPMILPCTGHKKRPARGGGAGNSVCGRCGTVVAVVCPGGRLATSGFAGGGAGALLCDAGGAIGCAVTGVSCVVAISGLPGGGAGNGAGGARGRATAGGSFNT